MARGGQVRTVAEIPALMHPAQAAVSMLNSRQEPCGRTSSLHPGYALKSFPLSTFLSR